jgi:general secretion pathway protein B
MSYILDALKKSETERRRGWIPTLHDRHYEASELSDRRNRRKSKLLWSLGLLMLLALAALSWQWISATRQPAEKVAGSADVDIPEKEHQPELGGIVTEGSPGRSDEKNGRPETKSDAAETNNTRVEAREEYPVAQPADEPADAVVIQPAPLQETGLPVVLSVLPEPAVVESSSLPLLADLPAEQRSAIPPISIEGHVYAEDSGRRMVMINKRVLREGEMAGNGIKLLRITWDGVVLQYADAEFQVKIE